MNMFDYLKEYGNKTFKESSINDIDIMIFSLLTYLDFSNIVSRGKLKKSLKQAGYEYLYSYDEKKVSKIGTAQSDAYHMINEIVSYDRYKNVLVYGYRYYADYDTQFGAITFEIPNDYKVIAFEGTDKLISGWKEDFYLASVFPVNAQRLAIKYINEFVSILDKVIVTGHSKGGNLALASSMYISKLKRNCIKKVYSLDGPGLRKLEFDSLEYKRIKDKYIHIIPDYSMVGILLCNDSYKVIKSTKKDIRCHALSSWIVEGNSLIPSKQSKISLSVQDKISEFINSFNYQELKDIAKEIFLSVEKLDVSNTHEVHDFRVIIGIIRNLNNIDEVTKKNIISVLEDMFLRRED